MSQIIKATHGSDKTPLKIGEMEIPCYVLEDGTRVLSGRGIQKALGSESKSGQWLSRFIGNKEINTFFMAGVLDRLKNPIEFKRKDSEGAQPITYGYEATLFIDILDAILDAKMAGVSLDQNIVDSAHILSKALKRVSIIALVDEATGYQYTREKDELQKILKAYIAEELLPWQKRFPDEFYKEIFRLNKWDFTVNGIKQRPGVVGTWTKHLIYNQLPKGVLKELYNKTPKSASGKLSKRLHQSLTLDIGNPHLEKQLISVITLMNVSNDWDDFLRLYNKKFGQQEIDFGSSTIDIPHKEIGDSIKNETDLNKNLKGLLSVPPPKKDKK